MNQYFFTLQSMLCVKLTNSTSVSTFIFPYIRNLEWFNRFFLFSTTALVGQGLPLVK